MYNGKPHEGRMTRWVVRALATGMAAVAATAAGLATAAPAHAETSLVVVTAASDYTDGEHATVTAKCPREKVVYGGGGQIEQQDPYAPSGQQYEHLSGLMPIVTSGWSGYAATGTTHFPEGDVPGWRVVAFAICGPNRLGYRWIVGDISPAQKWWGASSSVRCQPGGRMLSAGVEVRDHGFPFAVPQYLVPQQPSSGDQAIANAYVPSWARHPEEAGSYFEHTDEWDLVTAAVCVAPPPALTMVTVASPLSSGQFAGSVASCPDGTVLLGLAGSVNAGGPGFGHLAITALAPDLSNDPPSAMRISGMNVTDYESPWNYNGPWNAIAYAICAQV